MMDQLTNWKSSLFRKMEHSMMYTTIKNTKKYQPVASRLVRPTKKNTKYKTPNEITLEQDNVKIMNKNHKNTKKCQPAARDAPDLIQTECIPDRGLARPTKKNIKEKNQNEITLEWKNKNTSVKNKMKNDKNTKKCQPAARDAPDLIQTECIPDRGLARPNKKNNKKKNSNKMKCDRFDGITTKNYRKNGKIKEKKCQPAARDAPDLIQTECIPDRGLARPQKKSTERKNYKNTKKRKKSQNDIKEARIGLKWKLVLLILFGRILLGYSQPRNVISSEKVSIMKETEVLKFMNWLGTTMILVGWKRRKLRLKHKVANKLQKMINGNISGGLKIIHWNLGGKKWENKRDEIELLLEDIKPDLCYITEANLYNNLEEHEFNIQDHYLVFPNTMLQLGYARIMLIVRNGITVTKLDKLMSNNVSTIWVKIGTGKKSAIQVGGGCTENFNTWETKEICLDWNY